MSIALLLISVPFLMLAGAVTWYLLVVVRKRLLRSRRTKEPAYRVEPFYHTEHVYSIAQFKELMKKYSMDSDNGTSLWASEKGHWVDTVTGKPVKAQAWAIRDGASFDPLFTHIEFLPK